MMRELKALEGVKSKNQEDGERAETVEIGDAMHRCRAGSDGFCVHKLISSG
jgi:hypothetical protein